jgi:hypothetical protein
MSTLSAISHRHGFSVVGRASLESSRRKYKTIGEFEEFLKKQAGILIYPLRENEKMQEKLGIIDSWILGANDENNYDDGWTDAFKRIRANPRAKLIEVLPDVLVITDNLPYREFVSHAFKIYQHEPEFQEMCDDYKED